MQLFLLAKKFAWYLADSFTPPTKPWLLANGADEAMVKKYEADNGKYLEWIQADSEAHHYISMTSPIPSWSK